MQKGSYWILLLERLCLC